MSIINLYKTFFNLCYLRAFEPRCSNESHYIYNQEVCRKASPWNSMRSLNIGLLLSLWTELSFFSLLFPEGITATKLNEELVKGCHQNRRIKIFSFWTARYLVDGLTLFNSDRSGSLHLSSVFMSMRYYG